MSNPLPLKARLSISRPMGPGDAYMEVTVVDQSSGTHFLQLRTTLEDFMLALTGRGDVHATMDLRGMELIGSKHENKTELVPFDYYKHGRENKAAIDKALKPFEVDGWIGSRSDMQNGHCTAQRQPPMQKVTFHRYVDSKTGKPIKV